MGLSVADTPATTIETSIHSVAERSASNNQLYQPTVNYYEKYNPQTKKYEKVYYNAATARYNPPHNTQPWMYNRNYRGYYNAYTGRYENDGYSGRYNPYTGRYDRFDDWQYGYNPNTGRYNPNTGRYDRYDDGRYRYPYTNYESRYSPEFYGTGSVEKVHVPKIRYDNDGHWNTLRDNRYSDENGYSYSYETENGIHAAEGAQLVNKGTNVAALRKTGFYEYVGDDGKTYRVDYTADENGFHASVNKIYFIHNYYW